MTKRKNLRQDRKVQKGNWFFLLVPFVALLLFSFYKLSQASWVGDRYYLMAVVSDEKISVIGVNAQESRGYELILPGNLMVPVVGMQGNLKATSLWQFGRDEGHPERIVEYSLERLLGIEIDGVIRTNNNLGWFDIWKSRGNGELFDRVKWLRAWKNLRNDQKMSTGIPSGIIEEKRDPDGEELVLVNEVAVKNLVGDFWLSSSILNERIGMEIVNASGIEGIGKLAETMVKSVGGLVLKVDSGETADQGCRFGGSEEQLSTKTVKWLVDEWSCKYDKNEEVSSGLKIWLGKEWGDKYSRS